MKGKWTQWEWDNLTIEQCVSIHMVRVCTKVEYSTFDIDDTFNLFLRIMENKN